jgi:hypothetical protein
MAERTAPQDTDGDDTDDMDAVANRLEAALEQIARNLDAARSAPPSAELVARLDGLILRLRDILGGPPGPSRT